MKTISTLTATLFFLIPLAAQAQPPGKHDTGINAEVHQSLAEAITEAHADLAKARQELETNNLRVDDKIQFGMHNESKAGASKAGLPRAEITPQGDFLIAGKPQVVDASQRRRLLAYRGLVVEIGKAGIDIGQRTTDVVLKEVDGNWLGLFFSAITGSLERRVERTVKQEIEPGMRGICRLLPKVMDSQQRLASSLPQFQPYATLEQKDIDGCEHDVRSGFASL